jgi:hypothetical protein
MILLGHARSHKAPMGHGITKSSILVRQLANTPIRSADSHGSQRYPEDLPPKSPVFDLWTYDGTLERIHHALYEQCGKSVRPPPSSTARA